MTATEQTFAAIALVTYLTIIHRIPMRLTHRVLHAALSLVVICWCFIDAAQLITIDEGIGMQETSGAGLQAWVLGELRTTDLLFAVACKVVALTHHELGPIALKAMHTWFCVSLHGVLLVVLSRVLSAEFKPVMYVPALTGLLLLPTSLIAIKVLQYDFFAMELTTVSLFLILAAFRTRRFAYLWIAIPVAALATQEKMIAAPLMYVAIFSAAYAPAPRLQYLPPALAGSGRVLLALLICVATVVLSGVLVVALRPQDSSSVVFSSSLLRPLTQFAGTLGYFALHVTTKDYSDAPLLFFLALSLMLLALPMIKPFNKALTGLFHAVRSLSWAPIAGMASLCFFVLAAIAYNTVSMYWAPWRPVAAGAYQPTVAFNGYVTHFGSASLLGHQLSICAGAMAMFWAATPTAVWIALWAGLAISIFAGRKEHQRSDPTPHILICVALTVPLIWGLCQLPLGIGGKYFNIEILLLSIGAIWVLLRGMSAVVPARMRVAALGLLSLYIAEIALFLPLCFDFRPFYVPAIKNPPQLGELSFGWPGWGEEIAVAAKRIRATLPPEQKFTLVFFYSAYLGSEQDAALLGARSADYAEDEYFVVSKLGVVEGLSKFPLGVPPEFTIGGFGQPYAWVFRGDRLRKAGFVF